MSRAALWRFLAVGLPALAGLAVAMPSVDLTFGLRAGREILSSGAVPTVDTWTFTAAGRPWLDQQWGAQALLQLVFGATGWTGLVVLRAALLALAFGLLLAVIRLRAPRLGPIASTVVVIAAFAVAADALALRAQLFAIVLFAATLVVLSGRDRWPRSVWLIPVLAALWANLHGTFVFAPALCGLAWLADLFEVRGRPGWERHRMLVVGLVAAAATLLNPYGSAVWGYVANLTSNSTIASRVSEWRPPSPLTATGALVWLSVIGVGLLAARRVRGIVLEATADRQSSGSTVGAFRAPYTLPWPALLTLLLFGGFALASGRGTAWWPFVAVFVVAPWLQPAVARAPRPTPAGLRRINAAIATVLTLAGVALLPIWRPTGPTGVPAGILTYAPEGIAEHLRPIDPMGCPPGQVSSARVWNPQVWGSWLELAAPCNSYASDSRIELFTAQDWSDVDTVEAAASGWDQILDRLNVATVVTDHLTDGTLEAALGTSTGWAEVYRDADGSIWARTTPP